ncbi:MAG: ABC transporter ATP-binding protein [Parvibaculum sp.]|nr:ABC transporter ATP-binding protein [Parvibaculum sp.]
MLTIKNLSASLSSTRVLRDVSLTLGTKKFIGLIGPNGVGKTTLIRAVAGLIPYEGRIMLDDVEVIDLAPRLRAQKMSYLAQASESYWPLSVERLVALGRLPHLAAFTAPQAADAAAITSAMKLADVETMRHRDVLTLSGGERARVLLARALAVEAPLLLVDEPVAALDPFHQLGVMEGLVSYAASGRTVIAVLHDLSLAARYCDELVLLNDGRVHAQGAPAEVLTRENMADVYRVHADIKVEGRAVTVIPKAQL